MIGYCMLLITKVLLLPNKKRNSKIKDFTQKENKKLSTPISKLVNTYGKNKPCVINCNQYSTAFAGTKFKENKIYC
jgi:galactose-1-phosphate uridylyltransferase